MDDTFIISIAKDFSVTPGPRLKAEGDFSGEAFRDDLLESRFRKAVEEDVKLVVNLDGTLGYGTSFLEEAFGGLARKHTSEKVRAFLEIVSTEEPYLKDDVDEYIEKAND